MDTERKHIFTRGDIWTILFLLACLLLGGSLIIYQKQSKKLPPQLLIETAKKQSQAQSGNLYADLESFSNRNLSVNINTAPADSLELLPEIGPVYAQRIVEYRQVNGGFNSIDDLAEIDGIGPKTIAKIAKHVTVE